MAGSSEIVLNRIERQELQVQVKGTAPLIVHRFSEKAKAMMAASQQQLTRMKKAPKVPQELFEESLYKLSDGGFGFPAAGFKASIVGAARYFDGVTMTQLKQGIFVIGEGPEQLIRITGTPRMREDNVRIAQGTADLRYRGQFDEWSTTLSIIYVPTLLSTDSVIALVDAAGLGGVGEWRPSSPKSATGAYGTYEVVEG